MKVGYGTNDWTAMGKTSWEGEGGDKQGRLPNFRVVRHSNIKLIFSCLFVSSLKSHHKYPNSKVAGWMKLGWFSMGGTES